MTQAWKTVAIALVSSSLSAFGTNLVTNGTFDTDLTGWTTAGNVQWSGGFAQFFGDDYNDKGLFQTIDTEVGKWYRATFDAKMNNANIGYVTFRAHNATNRSSRFFSQSVRVESTGFATYRLYFYARGTNTTVEFQEGWPDTSVSTDRHLDNVVVEQVAKPYGESRNVAMQGTPSLSSEYGGGWVASDAINGVLSESDAAHTKDSGTNEWFKLRLPRVCEIRAILLVPRRHNNGNYLSRIGSSLEVQNADGGVIDTIPLSGTANTYTLNNSGSGWKHAKTIKVNGVAASTLNIGEIEVLATVDDSLVKNGDFTLGTNHWSKSTYAGVSGGEASFSGGDGPVGHKLWQTISTTADTWYKVMFDRRANNATVTTISMLAFNGPNNSGSPFWAQAARVASASLVPISPLYFMAQGSQTTIEFRDGHYNTRSLDAKMDNVDVVPLSRPPTGELTNVALGGMASLSSTLGGYVASLGADGDLTDSNFAHTANGDNDGWWLLELDRTRTIGQVNFFARLGFADRAGEEIELRDASGGVIDTLTLGDTATYYSFTGPWEGVQSIYVNDTNAADSNTLNIAEVEVLARIPPPGTVLLVR